MINNHSDEDRISFVKINKDDTIFLATPIYEGREKTFYKLLDILNILL